MKFWQHDAVFAGYCVAPEQQARYGLVPLGIVWSPAHVCGASMNLR
jgi:hypothetical protein